MYEVIKKANRFSDDEPEVIAYADSRSEAEALAHDYQVNYYGSSAYVTFRRAGERGPGPGSDLRIAYFDMTIEGFEGERSSSPSCAGFHRLRSRYAPSATRW